MCFPHHAFEPAPVIGWRQLSDRCGGAQKCIVDQEEYRKRQLVVYQSGNVNCYLEILTVEGQSLFHQPKQQRQKFYKFRLHEYFQQPRSFFRRQQSFSIVHLHRFYIHQHVLRRIILMRVQICREINSQYYKQRESYFEMSIELELPVWELYPRANYRVNEIKNLI